MPNQVNSTVQNSTVGRIQIPSRRWSVPAQGLIAPSVANLFAKAIRSLCLKGWAGSHNVQDFCPVKPAVVITQPKEPARTRRLGVRSSALLSSVLNPAYILP
jgi:hypothetical protein